MHTSSGLMMAWSLTKSIDSWLEKFLKNGYHDDVMGSPRIVKNVVR